MATNTAGTAARQDPRQVVNTMKVTINFGDAGLATGVPLANYLPQGAFIISALTEIVTAFNAGTTNPISVGSNSTAYNNIVAAADITPGTPGVYASTVGRGRSVAASGDQQLFVKYTPTGTAATTGQAVILIEYEGGWLS
jgi:hypothetical protein